MTHEEAAAYVMGQAAELFTRACGMMAENMQRAHRGESMAYTEHDFIMLADYSGCHHNAAMTTFMNARKD